ncbi:hypothetical protein LI031_09880 [Enterocloster citroniae]|uniref:hypothetical protein n=1 Tax=Enterocloster citroniae TaxID=358743 RepID=UPI001D0950F5|nr:hypothetical protein [Enterocloster citroniae]MCB7064149.1 hypothetical protein [Enterocloster citroniae]
MRRILEADPIIYPGEFKSLMDHLLVISRIIKARDIETATENSIKREKYLMTMAQERGMFLGQNEDPFEF